MSEAVVTMLESMSAERRGTVLRAVVRRYRDELVSVMSDDAPRITFDDSARAVIIDGERVQLGQIAYDLMRMFAANPGHVFSRDEIVRTVWGTAYLTDHTVYQNIGRLRHAIDADNTRRIQIVNEHGAGWRLAV